MIGVMLQGGLGNQLFQYACALRLATAHSTRVAINLSLLGNRKVITPRRYELGNFEISGRLMTTEEESLCRVWPLNLLMPGQSTRVVKERTPAFQEDVLRLPCNVCLKGYFQTEKYFLQIEDLIRRELRPKHEHSGWFQSFAEKISAPSSVVVHVRRGDYLTNSTFRPLCKEYFRDSLAYIAERVESPKVFVFSDDLSWCKANIRFPVPTTFVEHDNAALPHVDLSLMTLGSHFIISNSSFSWWGAWLAKHKDKIVVAPTRWFNNTRMPEQDIVPIEWVRL
jgi:hypothetical protein